MDYKVEPMWQQRFIGFEKVFTYDESYTEIPKFRDEIMSKYKGAFDIMGDGPQNDIENAIVNYSIGEYGLCLDDIGGGKMRYIIAGKYSGGEVPGGLKTVELPKGEWAKFKCKGALPKALQGVNTYVFNEWLPGNTEFELAAPYSIEWYSNGDTAGDDYESGIWIPVKRLSVEAKEKYGNTEQYRESEQKRAERDEKENLEADDGLMEIFAKFGEIKHLKCDSGEAGALVKKLQDYITANYYKCEKFMLICLGQMYVADIRFKKNIDRMGGNGTAEFVNNAIKEYCKTKK